MAGVLIPTPGAHATCGQFVCGTLLCGQALTGDAWADYPADLPTEGPTLVIGITLTGSDSPLDLPDGIAFLPVAAIVTVDEDAPLELPDEAPLVSGGATVTSDAQWLDLPGEAPELRIGATVSPEDVPLDLPIDTADVHFGITLTADYGLLELPTSLVYVNPVLAPKVCTPMQASSTGTQNRFVSINTSTEMM